MSSTKKFGLSQLALQNVKMQSGLSTVCNFYKNQACGASVATMDGFGSASKSVLRKNNSNNNSSSNNYTGRVSKLIGVKKTLVNQMQGMSQKSRPKGKLRSLMQPMSSKYSIYGQTTLFSSMSSLPGSSSVSPSLSHRRGMSSFGQQNATRYIVHQRYHQASKFQEKLNEDIARDISLSIKAELMDVDTDTKRLISCARSKYQAATQKAASTAVVGESDGGEQLEKQRYKQPRAMKVPNSPLNIADDLMKQSKPLRRKTANVRYKDEARAANLASQLHLSLPSLTSRKLQTQWGELFAKTSMERTNSNRSSNRHQMQLQQQPKKLRQQQQQEKLDDDEDDDGDDLMHVPAVNSLKKNTKEMAANKAAAAEDNDCDFDNNRDRYMQTNTERDFLDRNIFSSKRGEDVDSSRMDEQNYQSKTAANLMSASQRIINKQYAGYRNKPQVHLIKHVAQPVNPSPTVKKTTRPSSRSKGIARSKESVTGPNATQVWKRQKSEPAKSMDDQYLGKKLAPFWNGNDSQSPSPSKIQMGEKRQEFKDDGFVDMLQNDMALPVEYSKESAVQRLSTMVEKRTSSMYHGLRSRQ
ncbi:uncharacterized protein LOC132784621 [Drosophila nasuta]|uniref:uncharacterized protein LOC132784621 n=1 Tax=Drosophila nasuta TaxID=42062 RepID=UPI00295EF188|nr:uncharacterized protein LOC132784621 [Drosophila nasuta]